MSVLIKDMEMPESCVECRFYGEYCYAKGDENKHSKLPCPLVPVPPHGRLIDADAVMSGVDDGDDVMFVWAITDAPTVIEAEMRGENNG